VVEEIAIIFVTAVLVLNTLARNLAGKNEFLFLSLSSPDRSSLFCS
jgi:hypothetical protein